MMGWATKGVVVSIIPKFIQNDEMWRPTVPYVKYEKKKKKNVCVMGRQIMWELYLV